MKQHNNILNIIGMQSIVSEPILVNWIRSLSSYDNARWCDTFVMKGG